VPDGNDVAAVFDAMSEAVARARRGEGPSMLEIKTYRVGTHFTGDAGAYMPQEEVAAWKARDPIARCRARLLAERALNEGELLSLEKEVEAEVREAIRFAMESPNPSVEEAFSDVYVTREVVR
jgi:pyruvate dehydrogenase E1 component alpha subunit